jgi:hypothetical protein
VVYFHDWRYVDVGGFRWTGPDGEKLPLFVNEPVPPMHLEYSDMPLGIALEAQPAQITDPVITAQAFGEAFLSGGTMIREHGRYRLWYECVPLEDLALGKAGATNLLRYAESDDAMTWERPNLGLVERLGTRQNNIVYGGPATPESGYHGGSVFIDPSAPPEERFKVFHLGTMSMAAFEDYRKKWPEDVDPFAVRPTRNRVNGLLGGTSPDGLRWSPLPDPLLVQNSDTLNCCTYDAIRGKYVAYVRTWFFGRRTIGRTESDTFSHFPMPLELVWPDAGMDPCDTWYANGKTAMPDAPEYHLMFPLRWMLPEDRFEFHLMSSPDGIVWGHVPGGAVGRPGAPGTWNYGGVTAGIGLVELPADRMGLLVTGYHLPHKYPRRPPYGKMAWACWPKGRLVALNAHRDGSFALYPLLFKGNRVTLNLSAEASGYIQVEARDASRQPLPGRSFADCDPAAEDSLSHLVTWKGQPDLAVTPGSPVQLAFRMRCARLFSVTFV